MMSTFTIIESQKIGLDSEEAYVVVRDQTAYLRILGVEPEWSLMTATAGEDNARIFACNDQARLVEAALRLGIELNTEPKVAEDWKHREYVKICTITREPSESDDFFNTQNSRALERFFAIFDDLPEICDRSVAERCSFYEELSLGTNGEDIYLSDGMWLCSDGSLHDRGR